ncbi:hypothetical protein JCM6882_007881 [Rhodosporidiobolus microsporus]
MSSNVRPPSPFDKLPLELLKRVVELVKEQDVAFDESPLSRAAPDVGVIPVRRKTRTSPLEGRWSSWCGRGMAALSFVNKQFRSLTFSSLCEVVTLKQLASSVFRSELDRRLDIIASIRTLDMRDADLRCCLEVAPLLGALNLERVMGDELSLALSDPERFQGRVSCDPNEASQALQAFHDVFRKIVAVELDCVSVEQMETFMLRLNLPNIRDFKIFQPDGDGGSDTFSFKDPNPRLLPLFQQLAGLEVFELDDEGTWDANYKVDPSWMTLSLPSLLSVRLRVRRQPAALCELFKAAAPELRTLRIDGFRNDGPFVFPDIPSLRHLSIELSGMASFTVPSSTPLLSLTVDARGPGLDCVTRLPPVEALPPSLRVATLILNTAVLPEDADSFRAECAARGIAFRLFWVPQTVPMEYALPEILYGATPPADKLRLDPIGFVAAHETLEWAKERLDWCKRSGDDRTAQEIITALTRVRERQVLELQ